MPSALTQITPTAFSYIVHTPILDRICVRLSAWSIFECMFDYFSFSDIECMFGFCGLYKIRTRPPLYISPVFYITFIIRPTRGHYPLLRYFSFLFLKTLILMVFIPLKTLILMVFLFLPDKPDDSVFSFYFFFSLSLYSQFSSFFHFFWEWLSKESYLECERNCCSVMSSWRSQDSLYSQRPRVITTNITNVLVI